MTSEHTKEPTLEFFAKHGFFGLNQDDFVVFEQNMMPAFTFDGKIMLEKVCFSNFDASSQCLKTFR